MPTLIQIARSKSIWFANALIVCGVIQQLGGLVIPAEYQGLVMSAVGLVAAILRFVTNKALADK